MSLSALLALFAAICANSAANAFVKKAGSLGVEGLALYLNPWFIGGMALFGLNLLAYTFALKTIPLTVGYPLLVGSSLVIIALIGALILGEALTPARLLGTTLILIGAAFIVR